MNAVLIFLCFRYKSGVPVTLAKLSLQAKTCQPKLAAYPCWTQQEEGNCQTLQSAVDLFLDGENLLWVLDVGIVNTLEQPIRRCHPKILAYDVTTGKLVKTILLTDFVFPNSRLQYLIVDYNPDGDCFIYVSDAATRSLIVYDVDNNRGWRVVLPQAVVHGTKHRDVLYLLLIRKSSGATVLYFTYLSSDRMFSMKTEFLQKGDATGRVIRVGEKPGKIVLLGTDNGSAMFFRMKGESQIYMWDTETCLKAENYLLVQRGDDCRLATQVVPGYKRLMWVIESNFHDFIAETVGCAGASVALHPIVKTCD